MALRIPATMMVPSSPSVARRLTEIAEQMKACGFPTPDVSFVLGLADEPIDIEVTRFHS